MDEAGLRRIGFVTQHYSELRGGVTRAVLVPCLLAVGGIEYFNTRRGLPGVAFGLTNLFAWSALGIVLLFRSRRWLDRRFGRVQSGIALWQGFGILACQIGYFAASRLDDSYGSGVGLPSAKFVFIAAVALWFCVRLWPYSVHYFGVAGVAIGFALPFATLGGEEAVDLWEVRAFGFTLLAWTAAGLIDLMMLFRAMPQRPQEASVAADA